MGKEQHHKNFYSILLFFFVSTTKKAPTRDTLVTFQSQYYLSKITCFTRMQEQPCTAMQASAQSKSLSLITVSSICIRK